MQLGESDMESMSAGEYDERDIDWDVIDPVDENNDDHEVDDDQIEDEDEDDMGAGHQPMQQGSGVGRAGVANNSSNNNSSAAAAAAAAATIAGQTQDPSMVQSMATQMAAAMAAAIAAHQLLSSASSICGLDLTSLSNFAANQAQQSATRPNGLQTPEQLMAAAVAAASFLQTNPTATNTNNPTTTVPEDLTVSQQHQQHNSLACGLFGAGLANGGPSVTSPLGQSNNNADGSKLLDACGGGVVGPKAEKCGERKVARSESAPTETETAMSAANAIMATTFNKQLVAAVQRMALASGAQNGLGNALAQQHQQQPPQQPHQHQQQQQQQSISSAASNYLYHHFGQDAATQQLSSSLLAAAQAAAAAQTLNAPNPVGNGHHNNHHQHNQHQQQQHQQALQLNHLNHLSHLAAAGGALTGHHHQSVGDIAHHNHLTPASNHHNHSHHHHNSNSLANSLAVAAAAAAASNRSALLNNTSNNTNISNNNNSTGNSNNNNGHHQHHNHHTHHQHSTPTRHLLGHHHHSSIQTQQQLLATKGYNPLAAVVGQQTEILTPTHLRKAKLMFFYVRYPSSSTLKECFRDVRFNKNNTAQLVKWFSNFREFYYIQMEKFARECINDERIKCKEDIVVTYDHELINQLNNHYNKNRHIELPEVFRQVVEETLRHFFDAIYTKRDQEQSWKKAIYKIIQRMDQEVPEVFKTDAFNEHLE